MVDEIHGIQLAEGEQKVKEWYCAKLRRPKVDGYAVVTTRRLMYAGSSSGVLGGTAFMSEVHLEDIGGVSAIYGGGISLMRIITGVIFLIVSMVFFFVYWPLGIIFLLPAIYLFYTSYTQRGKIVGLTVYSKGSGSAPINFSAQSNSNRPGLISLGLSSWFSNKTIEPGPDAEKMVKEISACIMDIQSDSIKGPERWREGGNVESQLGKLKSLYSSGAITKEEYDQQRETLLRRL